jgi:nucleoside-diphosphate-sugar epimerase
MAAVDHVVLGAGAVGMAVAEALARRGESVRVVSRSGLREPVAGVQSVTGDVTDPAFAASATGGARVGLLPPALSTGALELSGDRTVALRRHDGRRRPAGTAARASDAPSSRT